jgi:hypothetical protein
LNINHQSVRHFPNFSSGHKVFYLNSLVACIAHTKLIAFSLNLPCGLLVLRIWWKAKIMKLSSFLGCICITSSLLGDIKDIGRQLVEWNLNYSYMKPVLWLRH